MTCRECRFFDQRIGSHDGAAGGCRRYPPTPVHPKTGQEYKGQDQHWPWVWPSDWCGEFQPVSEFKG